MTPHILFLFIFSQIVLPRTIHLTPSSRWILHQNCIPIRIGSVGRYAQWLSKKLWNQFCCWIVIVIASLGSSSTVKTVQFFFEGKQEGQKPPTVLFIEIEKQYNLTTPVKFWTIALQKRRVMFECHFFCIDWMLEHTHDLIFNCSSLLLLCVPSSTLLVKRLIFCYWDQISSS